MWKEFDQTPLELALDAFVGERMTNNRSQCSCPATPATTDSLEHGEQLRVGHEVADHRVLRR